MTIGETLAWQRQQRGCSVTQLSERTCIRESVIRAMENGDFSKCGGVFYARGHLRSIARVLGVDPAPLLAAFDAEHGPDTTSPADVTELLAAKRREQARRWRRPNLSLLLAVCLALLAVIGLVQVMSEPAAPAGQRSALLSARTGAASPAPSPSPSPSSSPDPSPSSEPSPSPSAREEPETVRLRISADERSWVEVYDAEGRELFQGILPGGSSRSWSGHDHLRVELGNPEGVRLRVNGHNLGSPDAGTGIAQLTVAADSADGDFVSRG